MDIEELKKRLSDLATLREKKKELEIQYKTTNQLAIKLFKLYPENEIVVDGLTFSKSKYMGRASIQITDLNTTKNQW